MAGRSDLLRAQRWERRRLLAAYRTADATTEVHPGRSVLGSLVVAGVAVGAAALAGVMAPTLPQGWEDGRILVDRESAERYVSLDGVLTPVPNLTSARLLTSAQAPVLSVDPALLADVPRSRAAGIPGAPDRLASPDSLVQDGWLACVSSAEASEATESSASSRATEPSDASSPVPVDPASHREDPDARAASDVRLWLGSSAWSGATPWPGSTRAPAGATLVTVDGDLVLVAGRYQHRLVGERTDGVLRALGLTRGEAKEVPAAWLALFEVGAPIEPFEVPGAGSPATGLLGDLGVLTGDLVVVDGAARLVRSGGDLVALTPVAEAVYSAGPGGLAQRWEALPAQVAQIPDASPADEVWPQDWPTENPAVVPSDAAVCGQLDPATGTTILTSAPMAPTDARPAVSLAPGTGVLMTVADRVSYVDEEGVAFPVPDGEGADAGATIRLLLGEVPDPIEVPAEWAALLPTGVELSIEAAQH